MCKVKKKKNCVLTIQIYKKKNVVMTFEVLCISHSASFFSLSSEVATNLNFVFIIPLTLFT